MVNTVINYLLKHKFFNIKIYDSSNLLSDSIVIGTGISKKQVNEVGLKLLKYMKGKYKFKRIYLCGKNTEWLIIDFDSIIVHLILEDTRMSYDIDEFYH